MIVGLTNLCTPAEIYMYISFFILFGMLFYNYVGNVNVFCLGNLSCNMNNNNMIFVIKVIYILFWTWILNIICRYGGDALSWKFLLIPMAILFLLISFYYIFN